MKRIFPFFLVICSLFLLCACNAPVAAPEQKDAPLCIVASVFPPYDFAREICGDRAQVTLLIPAGVDAHAFEPTARDVITITKSDLFLYIGGESDAAIESILASTPETETLTFLSAVTPIAEAGEEHETDEHIWTSPKNARLMVERLLEAICKLDPEGESVYRTRAENYLSRLSALDAEYETFFGTGEHTLIFGDRFPFAYLARDYGFSYLAAFPGCAEETEPSAAVMTEIVDTVTREGLPVIYYTEFSNHLIADAIADTTGTKTAMLHSCHNLSKEDLAAGKTYLSLMEENLETLRTSA